MNRETGSASFRKRLSCALNIELSQQKEFSFLPPAVSGQGWGLLQDLQGARRRGGFRCCRSHFSPKQYLQHCRQAYHLIEQVKVSKSKESAAGHEGEQRNLDHQSVVDEPFCTRQSSRSETRAREREEATSEDQEKQAQSDKSLISKQLKVNAVRTRRNEPAGQLTRLIALVKEYVADGVETAAQDRVVVGKLPGGLPGDEPLIGGAVEISLREVAHPVHPRRRRESKNNECGNNTNEAGEYL